MAITQHKGDWMSDTFDDNMGVIWKAMLKGYGMERQNAYELYEYQYAVWRAVGPNKGKVRVGIFNTPEEVVAMLKLLLASEEFESKGE